MSENQSRDKLGTFPYIIGGLSYIPLIGIIFGLIAVIWGLSTKKMGGKKLMFIGLGGILFTVLIYGSLFYFAFAKRGGVYDELREKLANSTINQVVPVIEFYKLQNGHYPQTLKTLKESLPKDSMVFLIDPMDIPMKTPRFFYYELIDQKNYYLLGVGNDNQPFTSDDILPAVQMEGTNIGLRIRREGQ